MLVLTGSQSHTESEDKAVSSFTCPPVACLNSAGLHRDVLLSGRAQTPEAPESSHRETADRKLQASRERREGSAHAQKATAAAASCPRKGTGLFLKACYCSVGKSCLTLRLHELQHSRPRCPSLSPIVCSNACPVESVILSNHLILFRPLLRFAFSLSQDQGLFQRAGSSSRIFSFSNSLSNEYSG